MRVILAYHFKMNIQWFAYVYVCVHVHPLHIATLAEDQATGLACWPEDKE